MAKSATIRIGISGWTYAPWRGAFYPKDLPHKRELAYAAGRFRSIEINGTFYGLQRPDAFARWRDETPDGFVFAVKGSRYITHMLRLKDVATPLANSAYQDIAPLLDKSATACRQLLTRARASVATTRRTLSVAPDVHARLLAAFADAASTGDVEGLSALLADDVLLIVDAGPEGGQFGRVKNLGQPLVGAKKVAAFLAAAGSQDALGLHWVERELNGLPALLVVRGDRVHAAILLAVEDARIRGVFMQADPRRLVRATGSRPASMSPGRACGRFLIAMAGMSVVSSWGAGVKVI